MKTRGICVCALLVVLAVVTLPMSLGAADSGGATCQPPASSSTQDSKMSTGTQGVYGPGTSRSRGRTWGRRAQPRERLLLAALMSAAWAAPAAPATRQRIGMGTGARAAGEVTPYPQNRIWGAGGGGDGKAGAGPRANA
jgi:hypothetical protein